MDLVISNGQAIARAELDVQISTAKAYPRDTKNFLRDAIEMATCDKDIAASCHYSLARRDKDGTNKPIEGPSIRLAEIVTYCWGNIHAASRIIGNDGKMITAEAVVWDLEKNSKYSAEVKRSIQTSAGKTFSNDMQVVTGNAAAAIAFRNAIFKVLPRSLVDQVHKAALQVAIGDAKDIDNTRRKCLDRLIQLGVAEQSILDYLGKQSIDEINQNDLRVLIGIGTAISEGYTTADNAFKPEADNKSKAESINELVNK